jgi:type II secretory pathway component PulF
VTERTDRPSHAITAILVGMAILLVLACAWQLFYLVPTYERRFEDLRMRLPVVTEIVIGASRFAVRYWFFLAPLFFMALVVAALASHVLRHRVGKSWLTVIWFIFLIGLPAAANGILWIALWLPYRQLR